MPPEQAVEASLRDHRGDPLVYRADLGRLQVFLGPYAGNSVAHQHDHIEVPAEATGAPTDSAGTVRLALGSVLKLSDTSGLDLDASLLDLGIDSLLALDLRKKLKKSTGHAVPLAAILGGLTGTELLGRWERLERETVSRD